MLDVDSLSLEEKVEVLKRICETETVFCESDIGIPFIACQENIVYQKSRNEITVFQSNDSTDGEEE